MESVVVDGNGGSGGQVVMQLSHIKDLVEELERHLGESQTQELCRQLASQISTVTERSISLITSYSTENGRKRSAADVAARSPLSDPSDAPFSTTKKRKTTGKVKHQVKASSAAGGDVPADDGHSWRKSYYRCTHRHSQGCLAMKQVQRTDEDSTVFDVVYISTHTCAQSGAATVAGQTATDVQPQESNPSAHSLLQCLSSNLTVKIEGLAETPDPLKGDEAGAATPFYLSSTPVSGCFAPECSPFSAPSTSENWGVSPATSGSFPLFEVVAGDVQFEFGEVVSAPVDIPDEFHDFDFSSFFA